MSMQIGIIKQGSKNIITANAQPVKIIVEEGLNQWSYKIVLILFHFSCLTKLFTSRSSQRAISQRSVFARVRVSLIKG